MRSCVLIAVLGVFVGLGGCPTQDDQSARGRATENSPIPPGIYAGAVTVTETMHCAATYALDLGQDQKNVTHMPDCPVTINPDGYPDLSDETLDMGAFRITAEYKEMQVTANGISITWTVVVTGVETDTGATLFTMPGQEVDTYWLTDSGALRINFGLTASMSDDHGVVSYGLKVTGEVNL
jgi:hypothetical protein